MTDEPRYAPGWAITRNPDGSTEGADPRTITPEQWSAAGIEATPLTKVIRAKCLDCSAGQTSEVNRCTAFRCALWPYRMGTNPLREKRQLSDEQRAVMAERLRAHRINSTAGGPDKNWGEIEGTVAAATTLPEAHSGAS